jgi:hypothetical protein
MVGLGKGIKCVAAGISYQSETDDITASLTTSGLSIWVRTNRLAPESSEAGHLIMGTPAGKLERRNSRLTADDLRHLKVVESLGSLASQENSRKLRGERCSVYRPIG